MLGDADQLLTVGFVEVRARLERLLQRWGANVVFSAERGCMPRKLTKKSFAHAQRARPDLSLNIGNPKYPFCLNSGGIAGRPEAIISMLNRSCRPCQQGLAIDQVVDIHSRAYSSSLSGWIYSEQRELMKVHLSSPTDVSKWILDMDQALWQAQSGWNILIEPVDLEALSDGRVYNKRSKSISPFVHYNGDSKTQMEASAFAPALLERRLRDAAEKRGVSGAGTAAFMQEFLNRRVAFIGPDLRRDRVNFTQICRRR